MLFRELDSDGSGALDEGEFKEALKDPRFKIWMAALDLQSSDAENLFKLLGMSIYGVDGVLGCPVQAFIASLSGCWMTVMGKSLIKSSLLERKD